jgi:hypothetical protein
VRLAVLSTLLIFSRASPVDKKTLAQMKIRLKLPRPVNNLRAAVMLFPLVFAPFTPDVVRRVLLVPIIVLLGVCL